MSDTLRFGLIGCGRIAPHHAHAIQTLPGAELAAVVDIVEDRAYRFADEYGAEPYFEYKAMLERDDIDVVCICTPSGLHAQMAIDAAQAGKHIMVEKPMALSLADADAMIAAARANDVRLCVAFQNRFNPPIQDLRAAAQTGRLGKLLLGNATVRWYRAQEYYEDGWHGTWAMDGGALMNQSIHHVDALVWLMGEPVESVFAYSATLAHRMEAEDTVVAALRFASGALASIEASTITYPTDLEGSITLLGEHGSVKIGGVALNRKDMWKLDGELEHESEILNENRPDPLSVYGTSHPHVFADMAAAIREKRDPFITGEEGRRALQVVLGVYESARTGQPVLLNPRS
ncbi:MAG: Gfo/Idh/MocA family oxidoreductase [Anaerolineae bacterium]|nr:Gfo/Idh/MocA family oxidoreductase [Anaerolineae bacterium]